MNLREKKILHKVRTDCITLQRQHQLTEFGLGQLMLVERLLKNKKEVIRWKL